MVLSAPKNIFKICHLRDVISESRGKKYLLQKSDLIIAVSNATAKPVKNLTNTKV